MYETEAPAVYWRDQMIAWGPRVLLALLILVVTHFVSKAVQWAVAKGISLLSVAAGSVASSVLFFIVTNFGTWATGELYPPTLAGLTACYVAAIPFFQNTLAGDLFFSALLFGGFALLERRVPMLRAPKLQVA